MNDQSFISKDAYWYYYENESDSFPLDDHIYVKDYI